MANPANNWEKLKFIRAIVVHYFVLDFDAGVHNGCEMCEAKTDVELLRAYVLGSADSFTELVRRHIGLVYSAALRQTNDVHLAEDVTQAVFMLLSVKAQSCGSRTVVPAWLYRAARYAARDAMKKQRRRQYYEARAAASASAWSNDADSTNLWSEIAPLLDDAMVSLSPRDQTAVLLRFFENRSLSEVGAALGTTQAAASQRVMRAVHRLRRYLEARGVTAPTASLSAVMLARAVRPAPHGLLVPSGSAFAANPAAASIAKGASKMLFWTKTKIMTIAASVAIFSVAIPALVLDTASQPNSSPPSSNSSAATAQPHRIKLPDGTWLELFVGDVSGNSKQVWNTDGTLLDPAPFHVVLSRFAFKPNAGERQIAVIIRAVDIHGQNPLWSFSALNVGTFGGGASVEKDDKPLDDYRVELISVDSRQTQFGINLGVALGQWRKFATWGTYGSPAKLLTRDRGYQIYVEMPASREGMLFVPVAIQLPNVMDWDERLFAILSDGRRLALNSSIMMVMNGVGITSFQVERKESIRPSDVVRYDLEAIPYTKITINGIALSPEHPSRPVVQVTPPQAFWRPSGAAN